MQGPPDASRVLIVDDEEHVLETASQILADRNYSVVLCRDASQALNNLQNDSIDIVLTDIKMPGISGLELLEKIREKKPLLPVILMTGYADLNLAVEAINKGAFNFIIKPYHPEYLLQIIGKAEQYNNFLKLKENYKQQNQGNCLMTIPFYALSTILRRQLTCLNPLAFHMIQLCCSML